MLSLALGAGCLILSPRPAYAAPGDSRPADELEPRWKEVRRLMSRQDYRGALQELGIILRANPRDPLALTYRKLCEKRLSDASVVQPASPEAIESLERDLRQEQLAQKRAAAQQKALEREIARQQAKSDAQLKTVTERLRKERERREGRGRAPIADRGAALRGRPDSDRSARPAPRAKVSATGRKPSPVKKTRKTVDQPDARVTVKQRTKATAARPSIPATSLFGGRPKQPEPSLDEEITPPEQDSGRRVRSEARRPAEPEELETPVTFEPRTRVSGSGPGTVELEPVTVPTVGDVPEEELLPARPAGAVQIFADHMNVAQDRQVATAVGHVRILFEQGSLTADRLILFTDTKDVYAKGHVYIKRGKEVYRGELVHYNIDTKKGRFLTGTASADAWYQHGAVIEHVAEGVLRVKGGYMTSCDFEPPHFRFQSRAATIFSEEGMVRGRHVTLAIEEFPLLYFPWLSAADRQSPFFFIPGKKKPWEQFMLMGYRYEWPEGHQGALRLDWRRAFAWGMGVDHRFEDKRWGKGLVKLYYNQEHNMRIKEDDLPKGAGDNRYRVLVRHQWEPMLDTSIVTDLQEFSDVNFRRDFLFREEFVENDNIDSFVSLVTNDPNYSLTALVRKRLNRFQTVTEAFPDLSLSTRSQQLGDSNFFTSTSVSFANLQTRTAHSENDTDVVRAGWTQEVSYAMNLLQPIELTPHMSVHQAYHTKDKQGGAERPDGERDVISGQFATGVDASLKMFKIYPVITDVWGLNINLLRHVVTPTVTYNYTHRPTVPNDNLSFGIAGTGESKLTFGLEQKLQTKRQIIKRPTLASIQAKQAAQERGDTPTVEELLSQEELKGTRSVDLARFLISLPYSLRGHENKQGGRLGDFDFDAELYPWPWLRLESNWTYPSHFVKGSRDRRMTTWNMDMVMVGGRGTALAQDAPDIEAPARRSQEMGPRLMGGLPLLPQGQYYLGLGHRFSHNDKTESVLQFDWRLTEKWQIGTFHRLTWKEVSGGAKRFANMREYQYVLTRDLHDWMAELVYRVDREFGEELFLTFSLKAYPNMPIEVADSFHEPKFGSQNSPFSPLRTQR